MRPYIAYLKSTLRLTARDKLVLFFNYLMPLVFFVAFGEGFGARTSQGAFAQVLAMVLMFGILGSGFFGGGLRATAEREMGILRRFKVAPITPGPILMASIVTGWALFIPSAVLFIVLGKLRYGVEPPHQLGALLVMVSVGAIAFRAIGLIVASVVNSMAENQILVQLLYLPMLMLSGATVPLNIMPDWLQTVAQFLPATHLYLGMQSILVRGEGLAKNWAELGALVLTTVVALVVAAKLFRWEKEEKLKPSAKLWVVCVLAPFLVAGTWQAWRGDNLKKTRILAREMRRGQTMLVHDARIFTGDGTVIERGAVLVKNGRIERIYNGSWPSADQLHADEADGAGRTLLPALVDAGVNLAASGIGRDDPKVIAKEMERALAAYLYCGVGAIRTTPDMSGQAAAVRARIESGELPGAAVYFGAVDENELSLVAAEAEAGGTALIEFPLTQQVLGERGRRALAALRVRVKPKPDAYEKALQAFQARRAAGIVQAPETHSGLALVPHGAALHRELQLWVKAGATPREALLAATRGGAERLGASNRLGLIAVGREATFILVDGNPLEDIAATTRIAMVMNRGERVARSGLIEEDKKEEKK